MKTNSPNPVDGDVQALIERCKTISKWPEKYGDNVNVMLPAHEAHELARIALDALTAVPEYNTSDEYGEIYLDVSKDRYDECHEDYRWISYPAPPAQLLRPVELPDVEENETAFKAGLNSLIDCLEDCGDAEQGLRLALRSISEKWHEVKS